jgi:hypothetical protein
MASWFDHSGLQLKVTQASFLCGEKGPSIETAFLPKSRLAEEQMKSGKKVAQFQNAVSQSL